MSRNHRILKYKSNENHKLDFNERFLRFYVDIIRNSKCSVRIQFIKLIVFNF